jgi:hypothetical protein
MWESHVLAELIEMVQYDKHCRTLLSDDAEEGWASELRRYLSKVQHDVEKDTDIVEWWQVSSETGATNILAHHFEL